MRPRERGEKEANKARLGLPLCLVDLSMFVHSQVPPHHFNAAYYLHLNSHKLGRGLYRSRSVRHGGGP